MLQFLLCVLSNLVERLFFSSQYQTGQRAPDGTGVVWGLFTCSWLSSNTSVSSFASVHILKQRICGLRVPVTATNNFQLSLKRCFASILLILPQSVRSFPPTHVYWQAADESLSSDAIEKPQIMLHLFLLPYLHYAIKKKTPTQ